MGNRLRELIIPESWGEGRGEGGLGRSEEGLAVVLEAWLGRKSAVELRSNLACLRCQATGTSCP